MLKENLYILLPFLLYAETHYSFKGIYSSLKKKEPEAIADIPHRIEPGYKIPILLLLKDCHLFPAKINKVIVEIKKDGQTELNKTFQINTEIIKTKYHSIIIDIEKPTHLFGKVQIDVAFELVIGEKIITYKNDNYRISSHAPFDVYLADQSLPQTPNWPFGDIHCHSSYTEDQAEFGAPLEPSLKLSTAMGLRYFAVNDHSYDLDDCESTYLKNDP